MQKYLLQLNCIKEYDCNTLLLQTKNHPIWYKYPEIFLSFQGYSP